LKVCSIDDDLKQKLKKFRFRKATSNAAIISKQLLNNQLNYNGLRFSMLPTHPSEDQPLSWNNLICNTPQHPPMGHLGF